MIPTIVRKTVASNPEDLADLVDVSLLDTATLKGIERHAVVMGSIVEQAPNIPSGLIEVLIPSW
jgi:hypothetical protein